MELINCIEKKQLKKALKMIKGITPENSIDLDFKDWYGNTALICASHYGHTKVVTSLLSKCNKESINIQNNDGNTALIMATCCGHTEIVASLLTKCSESTINIQDEDGDTALILASFHDNTEIFKKLIYLSDIHIKDSENYTAFDLSDLKEIIDLFDLNTGCDTSLRFGKSISNITLASLHSLRSDKWLNLF